MKRNTAFVLTVMIITLISAPASLASPSQKNIILALGDAVYIDQSLIIVYAGKEDNCIKLTLIYPKRKSIIPGRLYNTSGRSITIDNKKFIIKLATSKILILELLSKKSNPDPYGSGFYKADYSTP